jgi:hypothetical protein
MAMPEGRKPFGFLPLDFPMRFLRAQESGDRLLGKQFLLTVEVLRIRHLSPSDLLALVFAGQVRPSRFSWLKWRRKPKDILINQSFDGKTERVQNWLAPSDGPFFQIIF